MCFVASGSDPETMEDQSSAKQELLLPVSLLFLQLAGIRCFAACFDFPAVFSHVALMAALFEMAIGCLTASGSDR